MPASYEAPPYDYIAFIDEAGDPGIERVRPIDEPGASEWLIMGAMLIETNQEGYPVKWVRHLLDAAGSPQRQQIHYQELREEQKPIVCQELARLPVKLFAMLSNKKNMRQHHNERAAARASPLTTKQTFYNFCLRLILERITHCVLQDSTRKYGGPRYVKIIFSRRGGHSYGHTFAYQEILRNQSRAGTTFLGKRTIRWEVVHYRLLIDDTPRAVAGLQLADIVASAFYQAADVLPPTNWNPDNAKLLAPRIPKYKNSFENYGVTFVPYKYHEANLLPQQIDLFEAYGFHRFDFHPR